jgi:putative ABC transport system permease protein
MSRRPDAQVSDARMARLRKSVVWIIRTRVEPHSLPPAIRKELQGTSGFPVGDVRSMDEIVDETTARRQFDMLLLSVFGGSAFFLAAIGVYGVIAYSVQQRTREIGIRLALGAGSTAVRNMVVRDGLSLAICGLTIGLRRRSASPGSRLASCSGPRPQIR